MEPREQKIVCVFFIFFCECVCACATFKKAHFWAPARTRSRTSRRNGMASGLDHFFFPSLDEPLMQSNERSAHAAAVPSLRELLCPRTARLTQAGPALRRPHCIPLRLCAILFFYKILNLFTKLASCLRGGKTQRSRSESRTRTATDRNPDSVGLAGKGRRKKKKSVRGSSSSLECEIILALCSL